MSFEIILIKTEKMNNLNRIFHFQQLNDVLQCALRFLFVFYISLFSCLT